MPLSNRRKNTAIALLLKRQHTDSKIANMSGMSQPWVSQTRNALKLPPVKTEPQRPKTIGEQQITGKQRALILGLLKRGNFSQPQIARKANVHADTVHYWGKKLQITPRRLNLSGLKEKRILSLIRKGLTDQEIMQTEKISRHTSQKIRKAHGNKEKQRA